MKFYLASGIENKDAASYFADELKKSGLEQTYDWTKYIVTGPALDSRTKKNLRRAALNEYCGVEACNVLIALLPGGRGTHTEIGIALALGKPVIIASGVSPIITPCSFYFHPLVKIVTGWDMESLIVNTFSFILTIPSLFSMGFFKGDSFHN